MKAVMAEYRAKVKQQRSHSSSEASGAQQQLDEKHVKGPPIGGVWMGEMGKEMLEQGKNPTGLTDPASRSNNDRLV